MPGPRSRRDDGVKVALTDAQTGDTILARRICRLLDDAGLEVDEFHSSSGEARRLSSVHEGVADLSVGLSVMVRWAYRSEAAYDSWRHTSLRALVALDRPVWFTAATRADHPADLLERFRTDRRALSVLCYPPDGHSAGWAFLLNELLRASSIDLGDIRRAGGRLIDPTEDVWSPEEVDIVVLPYGAPGVDERAWARLWSHGLQPLHWGETTERVARRHELEVRPLPEGGLVPDGSPPALYFPRTLVFASERMADDEARKIISVLHESRDSLHAAGYSLDPTRAFDPAAGLRYHRAAIGFYREAGMLPETVV